MSISAADARHVCTAVTTGIVNINDRPMVATT